MIAVERAGIAVDCIISVKEWTGCQVIIRTPLGIKLQATDNRIKQCV